MKVVERWQDIPVIPVYTMRRLWRKWSADRIPVIPVHYEKVMKIVERWQDIPCNTCIYYKKAMQEVERWQDIPVIPVYYKKAMQVVQRWQDIPADVSNLAFMHASLLKNT